MTYTISVIEYLTLRRLIITTVFLVLRLMDAGLKCQRNWVIIVLRSAEHNHGARNTGKLDKSRTVQTHVQNAPNFVISRHNCRAMRN